MEEMEYIAENLNTIGENIIAIRKELGNSAMDMLVYGSYCYYFQTQDNIISSYNPQSKQEAGPTSGKASFIVRAFTTKSYSN